ncbi:MAG: TatD family hydrolase [Candidatus Phytoplasma vitis]|nr:MAG: TatD family hydrolase [Candidatus Phytoplasma vitis]
MLIDTHAHLNFLNFNKDLTQVIERAHNNGVKYFIVPGVNKETNEKAIELAIQNPCIKATVGIHPCYWENEDPFSIEKYLRCPQVVAVGEIGLDLYHDKSYLPIQKKNLQIQIKLAMKYNLPIILHARESFLEIYQILLPYKDKIKGVFHCLTSNLDELEKALELGFYVGLGGIVTYEKALEAHKIVQKAPLDKILLETDAPFLTPFPIEKSKRNEPEFLKIIAQKIADLRKINIKDISEQTTKNAKKLFNLDI